MNGMDLFVAIQASKNQLWKLFEIQVVDTVMYHSKMIEVYLNLMDLFTEHGGELIGKET